MKCPKCGGTETHEMNEETKAWTCREIRCQHAWVPGQSPSAAAEASVTRYNHADKWIEYEMRKCGKLSFLEGVAFAEGRAKSFGALQTESPQPAFMWALVLRENGKRKVAFSFDGPLSNAYVKLVKASEAERWRGLAEQHLLALEQYAELAFPDAAIAMMRVEFEKAKGE